MVYWSKISIALSVIFTLPLTIIYAQRRPSWLDDVPIVHPLKEDSAFRAVSDSIRARRQYAVHLVKMDSEGRFEWSRVYGIDTLLNYGSFTFKTSDGGFIIGIEPSTYYLNVVPLYIIKVDSFGLSEWARFSAFGEITSITETSEGYIIGGFIDEDIIEMDSLVVIPMGIVKLDSFGNTIKQSVSYPSLEAYYIYDCDIDFQGKGYPRFAITYLGLEYSSNEYTEAMARKGLVLFRMDTSGIVTISDFYSYGCSLRSNWRVSKTSSGNYLIVSNSCIEMISPQLERVWLRSLDYEDFYWLGFVGEDQKGNLVFAGHQDDKGAQLYDLVLLKLSSGGDSIWSRRYQDSDTKYSFYYSVRITPNDDLVIICKKYDGWWFVKTDSSGVPLWRRMLPDEHVSSMQNTRDNGYILMF